MRDEERRQGPTTEASSIAELAREAKLQTHVIPDRNNHCITLPPGWHLEEITHMEVPRTVARDTRLGDTASFIAYCRKWSDSLSEFYADPHERVVECIIDADTKEFPSYQDHKVRFPLSYSREFMAWLALDGRYVDQLELAEHLEDRHRDVVVPDDDPTAPSGLDMFQIAREFRLVRNSTFGQAHDLTTGEATFEFETRNDQKKSVDFPEHFYLGLPIFRGGQPYQLKVRARYRVNDSKLVLGYQIVDKDAAIEEAFNLELETIKATFSDHTIFMRSADKSR